MTAQPTATPVQKFFDNNGNPLAGGQLFTYIAGTLTPQATFTDSTQVTQNQNPVVLNARGEAQVWVPPNTAYKYVLTDSLGNQIWAVDQVTNNQLLTLYGGTDTGVANAYLLNFTAPYTTYVTGTVIYWTPANSNSGASTLNVNGFGVINIVNANGTPLTAGQLVANQVATVIIINSNAVLVSAGIAAGTASFTVTGVTGVPSVTVPYSISNGFVTLTIPAFAGTGVSTAFQMSTSTVLLAPPRSQPQLFMLPAMQDNGSNIYAQVGSVQATGSPFTTGVLITFYKNGSAGGWVATGTRGVGDSLAVTGGYGTPVTYPA